MSSECSMSSPNSQGQSGIWGPKNKARPLIPRPFLHGSGVCSPSVLHERMPIREEPIHGILTHPIGRWHAKPVLSHTSISCIRIGFARHKRHRAVGGSRIKEKRAQIRSAGLLKGHMPGSSNHANDLPFRPKQLEGWQTCCRYLEDPPTNGCPNGCD